MEKLLLRSNFPHYFIYIFLISGVKLHIHLLNMVVQFIVFLTLSTLVCRSTDISKCFSESLGIRDNGSRLYIENFTTKNRKFSHKNSDIFPISAQSIDDGYSLAPPRRGSSNEYLQSMFGEEDLILVFFVHLFDLRLLGFVCFLFLLVSWKGCNLLYI